MTVKLRVLPLVMLLMIWRPSDAQEDNVMYAHYINVGQAASVLLEFPCGVVLIDAGAQDDYYHKQLIDYLTAFFKKRPDLNNTIALIMVTHPHIDHNEALYDIAQKFRVDRYIDDGLRVGSGKANQRYMQDSAGASKVKYGTWSYEQITKGGNKRGTTNAIIDPINCRNGDPKIYLLSGQFEKKPEGWNNSDFSNYNNHSLVIKVVFGRSSFLFTGDLELKGIKKLVETYGPQGMLDADIMMVGHHGAANATTEDYLNAVTPCYSVISAGEWDFGKGQTKGFNTYSYGHPRISTINMLEEHIPQKRSNAVKAKAGEGARDFRFITVDKRVYSTSWDHTIKIRATAAGSYKVITEE